MPAIAALLLGMMGLAWVETHLLPPLEHHLKPKPCRSRRATRCQLTRQNGREGEQA